MHYFSTHRHIVHKEDFNPPIYNFSSQPAF